MANFDPVTGERLAESDGRSTDGRIVDGPHYPAYNTGSTPHVLNGVFKVVEVTHFAAGEVRVILQHQSSGSFPKEQQFAANLAAPNGTISVTIPRDLQPRFVLNQQFTVTLASLG